MPCCYIISVAFLLLMVKGMLGYNSIRHSRHQSAPPWIVSRVEFSLPRHPIRQHFIHHKHLSPSNMYKDHYALLAHIPQVQLKFTWQDYDMKEKPAIKKKRVAESFMKSAILLGVGAAVKRYKYAFYGYQTATTTTTTSTTTASPNTVTASTASPATTTTTASSTTVTSTTTPTTTTESTTTSTTESTTTTATTSSTTTPTTTTPTTTTTTPFVGCDRTTTIVASSVGVMGNFSFAESGTGNIKICQTVTAPPGTKIEVVCSAVSIVGLNGGGKYLKIYGSSGPAGTPLADPPKVGTTYTSSTNALSFEAFVSASDTFSCKWTVVAAFLRQLLFKGNVFSFAPFHW